MSPITVGDHQNPIDIAVQMYGTPDALVHLCLANGISITDVLEAGTTLKLPIYSNANTAVLNYYQAKGIKPATGEEPDGISTEQPLKGIGWMKVGSTFIVK